MADVEFHEEVVNVSLEGDIDIPGVAKSDDELSTLDEPIRQTVMRDLRAVGNKFAHVLVPKKSKLLLKEWDLWGPLILCTFMAIMLQGSTDDLNMMGDNDGGPQFAEVFVIYWVGAAVVTLNSKLLGGSISFFQSVCVLGYCVCPLAISLIVSRILIAINGESNLLFVIRCLSVLLAFGWSTFASTAFLGDSQPSGRKALAMFPLCLFYFVISWLIISHTHS